MAKSFEYDVFITYASVDAEYAEQLHKLLTALRHKTFLDTESLIGGDPWPKRITEAQEDSLLTVILFSNRVDLAYFQTGEILEAIDSARKDHRRRVIPVCLTPKRLTRIPSVLRPLQVFILGG